MFSKGLMGSAIPLDDTAYVALASTTAFRILPS